MPSRAPRTEAAPVADRVVTFDDVVYLSTINFLAAHGLPHFGLAEGPDAPAGRAYELQIRARLAEFSRDQPEKDRRGYENRAIAGLSFFYDCFDVLHPYLPYGVLDESFRPRTTGEMLERAVLDRIAGLEGGYATGGILGGLVTPMICPTTFYTVSHRLKRSTRALLESFLPDDFNKLSEKGVNTVANSRTSNCLGAVLLGPGAGEQRAEVLVIKESPYGQCGWGKSYQMTVDRAGLHTYRFREAIMVTREEARDLLGSAPDDALALPGISSQRVFIVGRAYGFRTPDTSAARVVLDEAWVYDPVRVLAAGQSRLGYPRLAAVGGGS